MLALNLEGLSLENRVKVSPFSEGIARGLIAVLAFCPDSVNRGAEFLNDRLHRLRMKRQALIKMRFQLGLRGPRPMALAAESMNLDQTGPQVSGRASGCGRLRPFGRGEGNPIGEDGGFVRGVPPFLDDPLFLLDTWSMANSSDYRTGRHCVFALHVHLVFVAKYRRMVFTKEILEDLRAIFSDVCQDFDATVEEFDGERDHVHLLITYPPKVAISRLVNSLKGVSSRLIRQKHDPSIERALWGGSLWSPSYFAGSAGGAPLSIIRQYIEQQDTPD
jgi:putative transposase